MILLIGANGRLGGTVAEQLLKYDVPFACLVRKENEYLKNKGVTQYIGDAQDTDFLKSCMKDMDTLIHTPNMGHEYYPTLLEVCRSSRIKKAIFIGSTSIFSSIIMKSKEIKLEHEKMIESSAVPYIILRPTMIYGTEQDGNMCRLIKYLHIFPVIPVFGDGKHLQQPVTYQDVAKAVILTLKSNKINKAYNIAGQEALTYNQVIDKTASALGRRVIKLHIPFNLSVNLVSFYNRFFKPLFRVEQLLRLNENKDFPILEARNDLGYTPVTFEQGITEEVRIMKSKGII